MRSPNNLNNTSYITLIELSDNKLSNNKLSHNNLASELVENMSFLNQSASGRLIYLLNSWYK